MIPAIIGAIGGAASAYFSRPKVDKHPIRTVVRDAKASGIHPLAALGSPAAGQYGQPTSSANAGSAVGAGLERFAAGLAARKSDAEIDALKASSEQARATAAWYNARSRSALAAVANGGRGISNQARLKMAGRDVLFHPGWSDTQRIEDRYGDLVGAAYGVGVVGADTVHNKPFRPSYETQKRRHYEKVRAYRSVPLTDYGPMP